MTEQVQAAVAQVFRDEWAQVAATPESRTGVPPAHLLPQRTPAVPRGGVPALQRGLLRCRG